jgi:hypothetical protein
MLPAETREAPPGGQINLGFTKARLTPGILAVRGRFWPNIETSLERRDRENGNIDTFSYGNIHLDGEETIPTSLQLRHMHWTVVSGNTSVHAC